MDAPGPGPGEELNRGAPTAPRQAATVIVVRGGDEALEVLLVKRSPSARFMGGAWVFPGGAVHDADGGEDGAHRSAAVRELAEEAGIAVESPGALVKFSQWITPEQVKTRFDTHFFLAELPDGQEVAVDGEEVVDARWASPEQALERHRAGELLLVYPTVKHLEALSAFGTARELFEHARDREVRPVEPRIVGSGETARILLPGEPGYEPLDACDQPGRAAPGRAAST